MIHDVEAMAALLQGTSLEGCLIERGDDDDRVLMVRDVPADVLSSWQVARRLLDETGRWPVAVPDSTAAIVCPDVVELAVPTWPWAEYERSWDVTAADLEHHVRPQLLDRARAELSLPTTTARIDRWTYDIALQDRSAVGWPVSGTAPENRLTYNPGRAHLALLPYPESWRAGACIGYYGAYGWSGDRSLAGVLRQWHERWGADLVANWDTMLELVVSRPPQDPEECWDVAGQLLAVGGSLQTDRWELALSMPESAFWFLHDRP